MNAKYRGRGCAIDSSNARAASSSASWTLTGSFGRPACRIARSRSSSGGSSAGAVEAPPGLGDELRHVLERLFPRGVEPQRPVRVRHRFPPRAVQPSSPVERSASAFRAGSRPFTAIATIRPRTAQMTPQTHTRSNGGATL